MDDDTDGLGREIHAAASSGGAGLLSPEWRGQVNDLCGDVLRAFWAEAVEYMRDGRSASMHGGVSRMSRSWRTGMTQRGWYRERLSG